MKFRNNKGQIEIEIEVKDKIKTIKEIKPPKGIYLSTIFMIVTYPPTDRYILWIISKSPYAFNIDYFAQFVLKNPKMADKGSALSRALETVGSLKIRGLIKQDENRNWRITLKGKGSRFTTHPNFALFGLAFAAFLTYSSITINHMLSSKEEVKEYKSKSINSIYDSVLQSSRPVQKMDTSKHIIYDTSKKDTLKLKKLKS